MSEPMSNREIEDVLSSIRRLVSDDLRPVTRPPNGGANQGDQPASGLATSTPNAPSVASVRTADKLLLTPDFRVQKTPSPVHDLGADHTVTPKSDVTSADQEGAESAPRKFDIHDHYEWLTDPDNGSWHSGTSGGADMRHAAEASGIVADDLATKSPLAAEASTGIEDVVSRLGAAVQAADDEWEAPMGDADVLSVGQKPTIDDGTVTAPELTFVPRARSQAASVEAGPSALPLGAQSETGMVDAPVAQMAQEPDAGGYSAPGDGSDMGADADTSVDAEADTLAETAAQAEGLSSVDHDPAEEMDHTADAVHPFARRTVAPRDADEADWADAAEAAVMEDLARDVEREAADLFDDSDGHMTFDEDVLRDLVRDIIREELAGSLGERITRNVRKLVRAEIARALAVREFE